MKTSLLKQRTLFPLLIVGLLFHSVAHAQDKKPTISQTQTTASQNTVVIDPKLKADQWGIHADEWQRYQVLMDGPLGIYSPGLDPLTALGISAQTDSERRRYAELQVIAETQRVERELAYQRAYDEAFKRMYPNLLPVEFASAQPATLVAVPSGSSRLAVFVRDNCPPCEKKVKQLHKAGTPFDLYMVASNQDDALIRRWATKVGIDPEKVFSKAITLNHDGGRWQSIGLNGDLPAVVKEVNGKWVRQ